MRNSWGKDVPSFRRPVVSPIHSPDPASVEAIEPPSRSMSSASYNNSHERPMSSPGS